MSKKLVKRYVVWKWKTPGIYTNWNQCKAQVQGFPDARYKSYISQAEAEKAYEAWYQSSKSTVLRAQDLIKSWTVSPLSICTDAACQGNPWNLERRWVHTKTGKELFRSHVYSEGTVNIGEYIALLQWLKYLIDTQKSDRIIYTDSRVAIAWIKNGKHRSQLNRTNNNIKIKHVLDQWELRYDQNSIYIKKMKIVKRKTKERWEIPADFGRK